MAGAIEMSKAIFGQVALPQFTTMMAEVQLLREGLAGAEAWLAQANAFDRSCDDHYFAAESRRLSAICGARRGSIQDACAGLREAIAIAQSQSASTFELRAALNLADLTFEEGCEAIRAALETFPEPEPWPDIRAAHRLLH
jgi:hypothetical protein